MSSTEQKQTEWQGQLHGQADRQKLVSAGDITYVLAALFLRGMQLIPAPRRIRFIDKVSTSLARLLYTANVRSTLTIRHNLKVMLSPERLPEVVELDVQQQLRMTVWNSLIMNSLSAFSGEQVADLIPVEGTSCLDEYRNDGHPVLVCGFHFAAQPLIVAAVLHARGYPIHAVTHARQMPAAASAFQRRYLQRLGDISDQFPVIDPREGLQGGMLNVLRDGEFLYITPDYMIPQHEVQPNSSYMVPVDFLKRRTWLQTGGLRLAKRLKAKFVTVVSMQDSQNRIRLVVEPLELPTPGFKPADLRRDLQECMGRLETQVSASPGLWLDLKRYDLESRLVPVTGDEPMHAGEA